MLSHYSRKVIQQDTAPSHQACNIVQILQRATPTFIRRDLRPSAAPASIQPTMRYPVTSLLVRAELTIVPGAPDQLPNFYHAIWTFWNHKFCAGLNVTTTTKKRLSTFCAKCTTLRENPGYAYEKRAPPYVGIHGAPEWLIWPWLLVVHWRNKALLAACFCSMGM